MQKIRIMSAKPYNAVLGARLGGLGALVSGTLGIKHALIVSSRSAFTHYGKTSLASLRASGINAASLVLPDGEAAKSFSSLQKIYAKCTKEKLGKDSAVIALGGGTIGDVAGFAASTYMRGICLVHVPTTLLAMVDSSIGGKTAINTPDAKNIVGTIYQPSLVACDIATLATLPENELRNGMAEAIKTAAIASPRLLRLISKNRTEILAKNTGALGMVVFECAKIKGRVISKDENEKTGLRHVLNFGHTSAHAIEKESGFSMPHGEAVAVGMRIACALSERKAGLAKTESQKIIAALDVYGLGKARLPASAQKLWGTMALDKKTSRGVPRFVLLKKIGKPQLVSNVTFSDFEAALNCLKGAKYG